MNVNNKSTTYMTGKIKKKNEYDYKGFHNIYVLSRPHTSVVSHQPFFRRVPRNAWACHFPTLNSLRRHFRKAVHTAYSFCRPPSSMTSITHRAVMHLHSPDYLWVHAGAEAACRIHPADTLTPSAVTVTCELISTLRTQRTLEPRLM